VRVALSFRIDLTGQALVRHVRREGGEPRSGRWGAPYLLSPKESYLAEGVGFEPTGAGAPRLFKSRAFVRSAIPPDDTGARPSTTVTITPLYGSSGNRLAATTPVQAASTSPTA
jgi:hypothetical protein